MGSCLSTTKTFQGEGQTLNEPPPSTGTAATKPSGGQRLDGGTNTTSHPIATEAGGAGSTSAADREVRARAAEQRMSQQAAKGNPNQGKLSQQLNQQKQTNPLQESDRQPERVVVRIKPPPPPSLSSHQAETDMQNLFTPTRLNQSFSGIDRYHSRHPHPARTCIFYTPPHDAHFIHIDTVEYHTDRKTRQR
ncbi:uncharacterized protein SPSC_02109 [Sporisorium scitamineum]|uniref:Uncharacterized protein n=1 Tax=Sporisorium scitamineum TaxID=49012 RepID=A0A127ZBG5_9BASI|nr:uncharacterized protein SPSC_02109 [Sporisorium scitamineum]